MEKVKAQEEYIKKLYELNNSKTLKYYILTMGCKLNENDSEKICGMVEKMGYVHTTDIKEADLYIINTCCIRENAEEKLFGKLGELKNLKKENDAIIAIGGCMMQQKHITDKIKKVYPFVDVIFGTHTLYRFPEDLYKVVESKKNLQDIIDIDGEVIEGLPIKRTSSFQAFVSIMYGCNNFCSYCIVPYVRGRERSRKPKDILDEIKQLVNDGYKEITLLGQNVNSYNGSDDEENKYGFAELLRDVAKIEGIEIIRFISPHPKDFTDDVIDAIKSSDKISKLIHVPLQSGNTKVLKEMNRKYTKESYLSLIERIKTKIPEAVFSTDIIVGFPGETDEEFEDTLDVVKKVNFEQIFMFIYSRRKGTYADKIQEQIPEEIKHARFEKLKALYESRVEENNEKYIGKIEKALVEGTSKNNENLLTARTNTNKVVVLEGEKSLIGKIINIEVLSQHKWYLRGKICTDK